MSKTHQIQQLNEIVNEKFAQNFQTTNPVNQSMNGVVNSSQNASLNTNPILEVQPKVQTIYNPVPIMTHYKLPVIHHIPINQIIKKYTPIYYPVPVEHRINIPVKVPIKIPQKVLIPQAVPYGVKVPIPVPVRVEIPHYKEIEIRKPIYVKIPVYEHIPIYHHFAIKENQKKKINTSNNENSYYGEQSNNENNIQTPRGISAISKSNPSKLNKNELRRKLNNNSKETKPLNTDSNQSNKILEVKNKNKTKKTKNQNKSKTKTNNEAIGGSKNSLSNLNNNNDNENLELLKKKLNETECLEEYNNLLEQKNNLENQLNQINGAEIAAMIKEYQENLNKSNTELDNIKCSLINNNINKTPASKMKIETRNCKETEKIKEELEKLQDVVKKCKTKDDGSNNNNLNFIEKLQSKIDLNKNNKVILYPHNLELNKLGVNKFNQDVYLHTKNNSIESVQNNEQNLFNFINNEIDLPFEKNKNVIPLKNNTFNTELNKFLNK